MRKSTWMGLALGCAVFALAAYGTASLSVTSPGLDGTNFKLAVTLDGTVGGPAYVQTANPNSEVTYRALFWLGTGTFATGGVQKSHTIFSGHDQATGVASFRVDLYQLAGGTNRVRAACRRDDGTYAQTTLITLHPVGSPVDRQLQIEYGTGVSSGFCRLTRFGGANPSVEVTGVDNDTLNVKRARLGAVVGIDAGEVGTYNVDEFESYQ